MIRSLACLVFPLALAGCLVQPAPATTPGPVVAAGQPSADPDGADGGDYPDDGGDPGDDADHLSSGELPAGAAATCRGGDVCNWECPGGWCDLTCAGGSTCNVDCGGGDCDLTCASGAVCNFDCAGGGCSPTCDPGSTCNVDD